MSFEVGSIHDILSDNGGLLSCVRNSTMANYSTRHLYLNHNNVSECHNETYNGIRQSLANLDTRTNEDEVIVGLSVLTILMIMSFFGNVITLVVVRQSRRIQSTTNIFVVSLALSDLGLATVCAPFVAADVKFGPGWPSGEFTCKTTRFFQHVTPASSLLILASISLDRYYSILFPMCLKVTREKAKQIIFGLWIIVLSVCIPCFKFYTVEVVTFPFQQRAVSTHYDELFSQDVARPMSSSDNTTLGQVPQCKILPEHISSTSYLLCPNFVPMKNIGRLIYCLSLLVAFFLIPIFLTTVLFGLLIKHLSTLSQSRRFRGCNMKNMPTNIISIRKVKMLKTLVIMTSISIFLTIPFHINLVCILNNSLFYFHLLFNYFIVYSSYNHFMVFVLYITF